MHIHGNNLKVLELEIHKLLLKELNNDEIGKQGWNNQYHILKILGRFEVCLLVFETIS